MAKWYILVDNTYSDLAVWNMNSNHTLSLRRAIEILLGKKLWKPKIELQLNIVS